MDAMSCMDAVSSFYCTMKVRDQAPQNVRRDEWGVGVRSDSCGESKTEYRRWGVVRDNLGMQPHTMDSLQGSQFLKTSLIKLGCSSTCSISDGSP